MDEYTSEMQTEFRRLLDQHYTFFPEFKGEYENMYQKYQKHQKSGYKKQTEYRDCLETFKNWCWWVTNGKEF